MRTELLETKLLSQHFSNYHGGNSFIFNGKYFHRKDEPLGEGAHGETFCFEAKDDAKVVVKMEKPYAGLYGNGNAFQKEAAYYQKIYGLGVFSGDSEDIFSPHYILMPYFPGKTLNHIQFSSAEELLFFWIKIAEAVKTLHSKHFVVHSDLKADNIIIAQDKKVFPIDFGMMMGPQENRKIRIRDTKINRCVSRQYPPEFFSSRSKIISADDGIDIYALGILLYDLYARLLELSLLMQPPMHFTETIVNVQQNLTHYTPRERWPIAKAIYLLASLFFSQVPRAIWISHVSDEKLERLNYTNLMKTLWHEASTIVIAVRINELMDEQEVLESSDKSCQRKTQKIEGLRALHSEIQIRNPEQFGAIVAKTKKEFPELTAGVFSRRTKKLVDELSFAAPLFH